jgi:hypothetical protein
MRLRVIFSVVIATLFASQVAAQHGEIAGKVTDENGEGIPAANITLVDLDGAPTGTATNTDMDGNFSIRPLSPGKYNLQVSYMGYTPSRQQGIIVMADMPTWLTLHLMPNDAVLAPTNAASKKVKYSAPKAKRNRKPL